MSSSPSSRRLAGFTLIELLVVISIISVLIAILLPALAKARNQAMVIQCLSNIRQTGIAMRVYANDSNEYMPPQWRSSGWHTSILYSGPIPQIPSGVAPNALGRLFRSLSNPTVITNQYGNAKGMQCTDQNYGVPMSTVEAYYVLAAPYQNIGATIVYNTDYTQRLWKWPNGRDQYFIGGAFVRWSVLASCYVRSYLGQPPFTHQNKGANLLYHDGHASWYKNPHDPRWGAYAYWGGTVNETADYAIGNAGVDSWFWRRVHQ